MEELREQAARIASAMADWGHRHPVARTEQASVLLYLKYLDEAADGAALRPSQSLRPEARIYQAQAERYRWREWHDLPEAHLGTFLRREVLTYMGSLEKESPAVAAFFRDAELTPGSEQSLRDVIHMMDRLSLTAMAPSLAGHFLESLYAGLGWREVYGSFGTAPALRDVMVRLVDPRPGDTVLDPAMGAGGLLAEAAEYAREANQGEPRLIGREISRTMLRIATVNLALRGLPTGDLRRQDSLSDEDEETAAGIHSGCDVILCDPPYGVLGPSSGTSLRPYARSRRREALFLELAMKSLAPGGRAALVLPDGILGDTIAGHVGLRKDLIEYFDVLAVLSLPAGRLRSQMGIRSSVVVFRHTDTWGQRRPEKIWFHQLAGTGPRRGRARAAEDPSGLAEFMRNWERHSMRGFMDPPGLPAEAVMEVGDRPVRSWWATRQSIAQSGFRLDAQRWAPRAARPPVESPEQLAEQAIEEYAQLIARLEALRRDLRR